ncbi:hypothetical protein [Bacillus methanolicus]|nr:hypothetical protein [Bacillus methanolicus]
MFRIYTDNINKIAITVPERFTDVKTGNTHAVSPKIQEQIEYHAKNNTLIHLVFSALNSYLNQKITNGSTSEILNELAEIKKILEHGYIPVNHKPDSLLVENQNLPSNVDLSEVEDVLEAFGG